MHLRGEKRGEEAYEKDDSGCREGKGGDRGEEKREDEKHYKGKGEREGKGRNIKIERGKEWRGIL